MGAVLSRQVLDPVPPLTTLRPGVPAPVRRAIERALSKIPADRFGNVLEFLAAAGGAGGAQAPAAAPKQAIVVLPFANLSPDPDNAYFADGLMEEVIADLSRVRALTVISRTSSVKLKETGWDLRRIGRELNVRYALEGSVRRAGSTLRITAQLIDTETDAHLWAEKYSGTVDDVFDLQERLSRQIVEALRITLSPPEDREIAERPIADIRAFEYYQRARQEYYRYTAEGMAAARALAEHGLAVVGPNEALYGMLGTVYAWSPTVHARQDEETTLREAEACARRAFELNPRLGAGAVDHGAGRLSPGTAGRGGPAADAGLRRRPQQSRRDAPAGRGVPAGRADRPDAGGADPAGRAGPADGQQSLPAGAELVTGRRRSRRAALAHWRAVELDPRSTICRVCAGVALVAAGREAEAAEPVRVAGAPAVGRSPGGGGGALPARALPATVRRCCRRSGAAERAMAESDEYWTYLMAGGVCAGGRDGRGAGLARACGDGPRVDRLRVLHPARSFPREPASTRRFQELMASARERYERFTEDGTPTVVVDSAGRSGGQAVRRADPVSPESP